MRALIDSIIRNKHWLLFFALEFFSFVILFSYNGYQKSVYLTTANDVVGATYNVISSITSYLHLQDENLALEAVNEELRRELYELRSAKSESISDSTRERLSLSASYDLIPAQVVNMTLHKTNNLITINKGKADGIRPEMGVVCSNGVVGIVYMTSSHYSIVMPLLNEQCKVSCRLRQSQYFGSLVWKRGYANVAFVNSIPRHAPVQKNDVVETNGYSDIFPPGLPIGQVIEKGNSEDGMSYLLRVKLYTDFTTLRQVSVIANYRSPERYNLEILANDPAKQDSILSAQEQQRLKEVQKQKEAREKAEEKIIKNKLEREHAQAVGNQPAAVYDKTNNTDTIR